MGDQVRTKSGTNRGPVDVDTAYFHDSSDGSFDEAVGSHVYGWDTSLLKFVKVPVDHATGALTVSSSGGGGGGGAVTQGTSPWVVSGTVTVAAPSAGYDGAKNVTTAGTRVALASSQALTRGVLVRAKRANTGLIYVGFSDVSSTVCIADLAATEALFVPIANLATVYLDASVSGEGVIYGGV